MPTSPADAAIDNVTFKLKINGEEVSGVMMVVSLEINRDIGRIPTAKVVLNLPHGTGDNTTFAISELKDFIPGSKVEIQLGYHATEEVVFKGIITKQGIRSSHDQMNLLEFHCSDEAVKMTLGRKNKFYVDKADSAIITGIIKESGLKSEVDTTPYTNPQVTQFNAVNWDFILARAEANGLLVYAEDGTLFVKKPEASKAGELSLTFGKDVIGYHLNIDARQQLSAATSKGWDAKTQAMLEKAAQKPSLSKWGNLTGEKLAKVLGDPETDSFTSSPLENDELQSWADAQMIKSRLSAMSGSITFFGNAKPKLNTLIKLDGFGKRYNGEALITSIFHQVRAGRWETTVGFGLSVAPPYPPSPAASGLLPGLQGLNMGKVKKLEGDPLNLGRIQVDIPSIDPAGDGTWARLANFYSTNKQGVFFIPEVGDEVVLGFINDDPRYAIILGMVYSPKLTSPYPIEKENKIKAITTKSELKIEFDDDQKILNIETPSGNVVTLSDKDKSILIKDQNGNKIEMNSSGITIKSAKDINLEAAANVNIKASQNIAVKASGGNFSAEGLQVALKAQTAFSAQGSAQAEVKSGGITTVKGSMVMIN